MERYPSAPPPRHPHSHEPQPPSQQEQRDALLREPDPVAEVTGENVTIIMRIGFIVAGGVLAAIACSLPAAFRFGEDQPGSIGGVLARWLVLSALATPAAVASVAILRRARVGLLLLAGAKAPRLAIGLLWWAVIEMGLLSVFAAVLRKTTHQHALAGVTFAAFAVASGAIVGLFARRTTSILARGGASLARVGLIIAASAAFLAILLVGIRTSRAEGMHTAAALVDTLAFAVTTAIGSSKLTTRVRPLAIAGVPAAVLLIMIGLTTLRFDPEMRKTLGETAPMHSLVLDVFGRDPEGAKTQGAGPAGSGSATPAPAAPKASRPAH